MPKKTKDKITISIFMDIPPPQVRMSDLHENGLLLSDEDIKRAQFLKRRPGRTHKRIIQLPFDIILDDKKRLYAVYYGDSKPEREGSGLGKGQFGKVKLAQDLETGKWYALKSEETKIEPATAYHLIETKALQQTGSLKFAYGHRKMPPFAKTSKQMIMELVRGKSLVELIGENLPLITKINFIISVAEQLKILEQHKLIHRDIKPENALGNHLTGEAKLIDYGMCVEVGDDGIVSTTMTGSPNYCVPEQKVIWIKALALQTKRTASANTELMGYAFTQFEYSQKTDCYGFGVMVYELLMDELVDDVELDELKKQFPELHPIVEAMLSNDSAARPSYDAIIDFFQQKKNSLVNITPRSVGYLDMVAFNNASEDAQKLILEGFKRFNQVCLTHDDKHQFNAKAYSEFAQLLLKHDILTENHVVIYPAGKANIVPDQYGEFLKNKNILATNCSTFIDNAMLLLKGEAERLDTRMKKSTGRSKTILKLRIDYLNTAIAKFEEKPENLNDFGIRRILEDTTQRMHSTSKSSLIKFFRPSTSKRKLRKFMKDNPSHLQPTICLKKRKTR